MEEEFKKYIDELHDKGLHLECGYGCEFLEFICSGDPETEPHCPYCVTVDDAGNEVD